MKRLTPILVILTLIVSVGFAYAGDEKSTDPASPAKTVFVPPCKKSDKSMTMECPMMKRNKDIKVLLINILQLQQRSLTASSKEKVKIKEEISNLVKKIDAMPDKMECPMMNMNSDSSSDKKVLPEEKAKEETKSSEHKH
ncbi:MAG: hypothetical protein A4E71_00163 [Smithella sp. PtaU1.Bin162]|nr:MAG: hypothetical protein A4E71_00163 [Smithella sp. PtaU1.Bin162]